MYWRKIKALLQMTRPINGFTAGIAAVFAYLVNTQYNINPYIMAIGFMVGYLGSASAMLINDVVDLEVDRINKPWKPLPQGILSKNTVAVLSIIFLSTSIAINLLISIAATIVAALLIITGYCYSFMRRFWWSHFIVSISTIAPFIYGYVVAGMPSKTLVFNTLFAMVVFLINSSREFTKAIADYEGDKKLGYSTIATKYGICTASFAAVVAAFAGAVLAVLIGLFGLANMYYTIILFIAGSIFSYYAYRAYRDPSKDTCTKAKNVMIFMMLFALLGYLLSQL